MGIKKDIKRIRNAVEMMAVLELRMIERMQVSDTGPLAGMDILPPEGKPGAKAAAEAAGKAQADKPKGERKPAKRAAKAKPEEPSAKERDREPEESHGPSQAASQASESEGGAEAARLWTRDEAIALAREKVGSGVDREEIFEVLDKFKAGSIGDLAEKDLAAFCEQLQAL